MNTAWPKLFLRGKKWELMIKVLISHTKANITRGGKKPHTPQNPPNQNRCQLNVRLVTSTAFNNKFFTKLSM